MFCELEVPYEAARVRVRIAEACRELGDQDAADLEIAAARDAFEKLGALTDLDLLRIGTGRRDPAPDNPLTERELEVLKLVAAGMTNRSIAGKLSISEKTVARHISNIFTKLDLSSRAAATAYAYQRGLV